MCPPQLPICRAQDTRTALEQYRPGTWKGQAMGASAGVGQSPWRPTPRQHTGAPSATPLRLGPRCCDQAQAGRSRSGSGGTPAPHVPCSRRAKFGFPSRGACLVWHPSAPEAQFQPENLPDRASLRPSRGALALHGGYVHVRRVQDRRSPLVCLGGPPETCQGAAVCPAGMRQPSSGSEQGPAWELSVRAVSRAGCWVRVGGWGLGV